MFKKIVAPILLYVLIVSLKGCSLQRCCLPSTCTSNYCITRSSETWISTQNFANYGYTKLVLGGGQCVPCSYNCQACSSQTSCSTCSQGFYSSGGQCLLCSYACLTCQVSNGISKCSACSTGTYLDSTTAACKNCAAGASACSSATVITSCKTGYLLTSNSLFCLPCPTHCSSCPSSDSLCSSCLSGYYLNSSKCYICTVGNCSTCAFLSSKQTCTLCNSGYVLSSGACNACPTNCQSCSSTTICTRCSSGYYLVSGGCLAATMMVSNCNLYSSSTVCSSCLPAYYLLSSKCQPCSMLCTSCYGLHFGQCSTCATNAVLFNQMCLPINYLTNSQYQLYFSYPSSSLLFSGGSPDCNRYLYSGTSLTLSLNRLAASQIRVSWRLFSVNGSTTYSVTLSSSAAASSSVYSTSSSSGESFSLCGDNSSVSYSTGRESSLLLSVIKYNNTLTFATNNGVKLALQQVLVVAEMCNSLCVECSSVLCTQCELTNLYTQDAYCVYTCSSGYYIFDNLTNTFNPHSCVQQCPVGTYPRSTDLTCALCVSPCLSCLNDNYCLSCILNYFLTEANTCVESCPYRYFGELLTQTCSKCVGRCDTCLDQFRCLSCNSGFFYSANYSCLDSCSPSLGLSGLYASLQTLSCELCSSMCLNCLMEEDYCTSCSPAFVFYNYTCLGSCPSGYYPDADSICQACSYPCEKCAVSSTNCTSCFDRYLLSNSCITNCPSGYFENNNGLTCGLCSASCSECINSATYCTACQTNFYYFNNTCNPTCPERYFADSGLGQCIVCSGLCYKCTNNTFCLSCTANFLWEGSCVTNSQCPQGYYAEIALLSCQKCDSSCLTCQFSPQHCTSCNQNSSAVYLQESKCLSSCSSQLYYAILVSGVNQCVKCRAPCSSCLNSSYCLTCQAGYMLSSGICSTLCTAAHYFDSETISCSPCTANCLVCNAAIFCQLCLNGFYISSLNSSANQCVEACPSGFYANTQGGSCQPCLYPCLQCLSSLSCLSCQTGILYLNRCISSCPDTTFYDADSNVCMPCTGSCLTCIGSSTYCLSCQANYFLYSVNSTCLQNCLVGTYAESVTQMCLQCPSNCAACINSTYCTSCPLGRAYLYQSTHNCITSCPLGYFGEQSQGLCLACDSKCLTCRSIATNCLSCVSNFYLIQLSVSTYDCVTACPLGYYHQAQSCQLCIFPCDTCSSASSCLTCVVGTYYYSLTSSCLLSCPANSYLKSSTSSCQLCSAPCISCKSDTHCLSCVEGLFLNSGSCVQFCPSVTYADTTKICLPCLGLCKTCSSLYYCMSCLTGYLSNGFCYDSCPPGTYANLNTSQCVACISPCVECAFSAVYCTRCLSGLLQYQGNCSSSCPLGTFISDGSCLSCSFPCINCSSSTSCHECLGGYLLYNQITCINDVKYCPNDFFKMDGKYCLPQVQCPSSYYKDFNQRMCSRQCSPEKYVDQQTKTCNYNCKSNQYVSTGMICRNFTTQPLSLMGMSVISFIKSSVINLVVIFNQTETWLNSNSSVYSLFVDGRLLTASASSLFYTLSTDDPKLLLLRVTDTASDLSLSLPAYNVISSTSSYPLQTPNITVSLPTFVPYDYSTIYQGYTAQQFGQGLGWFIWLLTVVFLFKNRISHLYILWDTVQLIYMLLFLEIQYPPTLNQFMCGLSSIFFHGFPNIFPVPSSRMISDRPFYAYSTDNSFLRNAGAPLTLLLIVIAIYAIFKIIEVIIRKTEKGKSCTEKFPQFKKLVFAMLLRYRWHHASDIFFLTFSNVCLFGVAELVNASSNPANILSNTICCITLLIYVAFPIFVSAKLFKHFPNIKKGRHVQNLRCFYRGIDKTSQFGIFLVVIRYFRKILYALVVGVFSSKPMYAVPILMMVSGLIALFIFVNLPYKKRLSNVVETITELCIAILYLGFALINFNNRDLNTSLNITMGYLCTGLFIFILLLEVFEIFCRSLFKLESEEELRKKSMKTEPIEEEKQLRKKAAEFFDFMFPRIRKDFAMEQDSEDEVYHYQQGDSQNSQNNQQRERSWEINSSAHSEQFRHYDNNSESEQATQPKRPPEYLVRCVKEIE